MQGKSINGYTLKHLLGKGGMAEVWYAENSIEKAAAVKILREDFSHNPDIVDRFKNEAKVMVKLSHANIRQVYDYGDIGGRPAIVMEYLEGDDLKARMKNGERFSEQQLVKWWNQMVAALNYTHAKGIVHRDIKPSNIFIDTEDNVRLLDFGIAKIKESISSTQTGSTLGTLLYMSPEQIDDVKHVDYRTDVYSLAVTFVHLLTGKAPYDATTTSDYQIRKSIVEKPLDLTALPATWSGFLTPYLAKDREQRPALKPFVVAASSGIGLDSFGGEGTIIDSPKKPGPKPQPKPSPTPKGPTGGKPKRTVFWVALAALAIVGVVIGVSSKSGKEVVTQQDEVITREVTEDSTAMVRPVDSDTVSLSNQEQENPVEAKTATSAAVTLTSNVAEAQLTIDGQDYGAFGKTKKQVMELDYGTHQVEATAEGYDDYSKKINVSESRTAFKVEMKSKAAPVQETKNANSSFSSTPLSFTANGVSFKMLPVEGGTFTMGATAEQGSDAYDDEKPAHSVTLSSYYMGETEVTQALWQAVMGSNPSNVKGNNLPVESVSWDDCQTFINMLNQLLAGQLGGKRFALPTEAQWEYAARGGKHSKGYKYSGSNTLGNVAWYWDNNGGTTHAVGTKQANELGLYDMSGNVWEWCSDWYGDYGSSAQTDPTGPATGSHRVYRGGSWFSDARGCRVSNRLNSSPGNAFDILGLRLSLR